MAGAFVGGAVLGTASSALYEGVKEPIRKNHMYKSLCKDIKSSLDSLEPLILQIQGCNNALLYCSKEELEGLEQVMKEGVELVDTCLKVSRWNPFKKYKYANKLIGWDESLKRQLDILKVQETGDVKKIGVKVEKIGDKVAKIEVTVEKILIQSAESSTSGSTTQHELCKVLELPSLPRLVVGLDAPLKELKSKLLENDGMSILVVTAPGGCGKTTLATMFCQDQQVKDKFSQNIIFVTVSQNGTLNLVVQRLCEHKGSQVPTLQNEVHAVQ